MVALVTARARVPAMAGVGGPAAGRVARRRRDLLRSSASRGAVTWKPLRPVEKFGTRFEGAEAPAFVLPNLGRQTGTRTDRRTDGQVGNSGTTANSYRFAHALISRWRLISEASLSVFRRNRGWGRKPTKRRENNRVQARTPRDAINRRGTTVVLSCSRHD